MTAKVLLVSSVGWPSVARLAAGFAWASCAVEALAPAGAIVLQAAIFRAGNLTARFFRSLRCARRSRQRSDLLVCCDDRSLSHVLELYRRPRARASLPFLSSDHSEIPRAIPRLISRSSFLAEARAEGIRVPDTMAIGSDEVWMSRSRCWVFPPCSSRTAAGAARASCSRTMRQKRKRLLRNLRVRHRVRAASRVRCAAATRTIWETPFFPRRAISARSGLSRGSPAASAFASWQGEVAGAIYYDVIVAEGAIGPPNVIRRVDCPEIHEATLKITKRFGLSGIHGMDFIRDAQGAVHLIEINPRATQGSTLAFGRGRDLPAALAERLTPAHASDQPSRPIRLCFSPRMAARPREPFLDIGASRRAVGRSCGASSHFAIGGANFSPQRQEPHEECRKQCLRGFA